MQPIQNPTSDLTEGLYKSIYHMGALVYVKCNTSHPMYRFVSVNTYLVEYKYFESFNRNSIVAKGLVPLVLEPIPDNVVISTIYPELFI